MRRPKGFVTRQAKRLSDGEINRRRFVMSALSAGVTMPTAVSLASRAEAHVPKPGGHFRIGVAETRTFNALTAFTHGNALTEVTASDEITGELASAIETPDDGATWYITLRDGVTFHDGTLLTEAEVIETLNRHRGAGAPLSDVIALRKDTHRVALTLSRPEPDLPRRLADPRLTILKGSQDTATGTGPYLPDGHARDGSARFTRNPHYWKPGRAHFETISIRHIPDTTTRLQAVLAGDVDYADMIDPPALGLLHRAPTLEILETRGTRHLALTTRGTGRALEYVIPERALLEQVLLGHGNAAGRVSAPDLAYRLHEPANRPLRLALRDPHLPGVAPAARLIATEAERAGIPVEITETTGAEAEIGWSRARDGSSCIAVWANDLAAHAKTLSHAPDVATDLENDGARIAERWWFA